MESVENIIAGEHFDAYGIARYDVLVDDRGRLEAWLAGGNNAAKAYLERNDRHDPRLLLPTCKSVVVVLFSPQREGYHNAIRKRLKKLLASIQASHPSVNGRAVVDTAPIFEKSWGVRAGLGSIGRNTLLLHPTLGSNFNIGILLLDVELTYSEPFAATLCPADCRACIENCPSGALYDNRTLDCRVCLSYISQITPDAPYGCTICQSVCCCSAFFRDK